MNKYKNKKQKNNLMLTFSSNVPSSTKAVFNAEMRSLTQRNSKNRFTTTTTTTNNNNNNNNNNLSVGYVYTDER